MERGAPTRRSSGILVRRVALSVAAAWLLLAGFVRVTRAGCPGLANPGAAQGWSLLEEGQNRAARSAFERTHQICPDHVGARVGLAYAAMRLGDDADAGRWFRQVLEARPEEVDAWVGTGMLAWRAGDLERVDEVFRHVLALDHGREDVLPYLAQIPEGYGAPPPRAALKLPDTLEYRSRARGDRFEVRVGPEGWQPFYVKGVNLGAALPGRHPSEFPDSATYAGWLSQIAEMGANTVRVYTIHPPAFYKALHDHNARAPSPLWLVHGVWAELPPDDDYDDPRWEGELVEELRTVVDVVHGRADIRPRPGHASGHYVADVSPWTLGWVVGREWEPYSVGSYNERQAGRSSWRGRYLEMDGGTPMDAWLARTCERIVAYETETYGVQRPVAYTSWPTLDPLTHATEATFEEEAAIRLRFGEAMAPVASHQHEEDAETVDPSLVRATRAFPAGYFAAYHVYPYYPDFMVLDPEYNRARSPLGPSNYFGYLRDLKRHHEGMPVLIAEYGVPTSLGVSHIQPDGWHHGGIDEREMAELAARMTHEIAMAGMAGGVLFAWMDEWFKKNWLTQDFALPGERNRLWLNLLDPEQQYGVVAMEPEPRITGGSLEERLHGWRELPALYSDGGGTTVRGLADEAVLHLLVELGAGRRADELLLGLDVSPGEQGSVRWPGAVGPEIPTPVDFALSASTAGVRLLASPVANPFDLVPDTIGEALRGAPAPLPVAAEPPGLFRARARQAIGVRRRTATLADGRFEPLRVLTNGLRFGRDGTEYLAMGYDRGILPGGAAPDGFWEWSADGSVFEVRIPWMLVNVTDPSARRTLRIGAPSERGELATVETEGIRVVLAVRTGEEGWHSLPASGRARDVALFTWPTWDEPRWRSRRRPIFETMREAFFALDDDFVTTMDGNR